MNFREGTRSLHVQNLGHSIVSFVCLSDLAIGVDDDFDRSGRYVQWQLADRVDEWSYLAVSMPKKMSENGHRNPNQDRKRRSNLYKIGKSIMPGPIDQ